MKKIISYCTIILLFVIAITSCSLFKKAQKNTVTIPPPAKSSAQPKDSVKAEKKTKVAPFNVPAFAYEVKKPVYNIAIFAPKGSNSNYVYDSQQPTSLAFYRLKIVEKDGHVSYGPVISLLQNDSKDDLVIYPNPAHGHLFVEAAFSGPFKLYNASGRLVLSQIVKKGRNDIWLSNLRPGIYFGLLKGHKVNIVIK